MKNDSDLKILFRHILEVIENASFLLGNDGQLITVNQAFFKLTNVVPRPVHSGQSLIAQDCLNELKKLIHHADGALEIQVPHFYLRSSSGIVVNVKLKLIEIEFNKKKYWLGKIQREEERSILQNEEILSIINHDMRTPLNGIIGFSQVLLEDDLEDDIKVIVENIAKSGSQLFVTLNELLDLAKIQNNSLTLKKETFHFHKLINEITTLFYPFTKTKGIEFQFQCDPKVPAYIIGDEFRMKQILNQLIESLITQQQCHKIFIHFRIKEGHRESLEIEVKNYYHSQQDLYNNHELKSVGKTLANKVIDLMGGSLSHLKQSEGESFLIELPFHLGQEQSIEQNPNPDKRSLPSGLKILLVEDNEINQQVVEKILEREKTPITIVNNGQEAVEAIRKNHFDLILMDCEMPILNGYDSTIEIRKIEKSHQTIIALTANTAEEEKERCFACGMDDYLGKPFHKDELIQIILKWTR